MSSLVHLVRVALEPLGHAARLKPAVEYLLNAAQLPLAHFTRDSYVIDEVFMNVSDASDAWKFLEFFNRPYHYNLFAIIASPNWNRVSPIPVSWETPVPRFF